MGILKKIKLPSDIKKLTNEQKNQLCSEVRKEIIETVSKNGGHLSSNLGAVELTVAVLSVFSPPEDKIIFDVGHQSYAYKILTDRRKSFETLRLKGGVSGFPKIKESKYDSSTGGHASDSVSMGIGISAGKKIKGENENIVAITGDGAMSGGLVFEGLNNIHAAGKMIMILNDNEMSISDSVGSFSNHLSKIRSTGGYIKAKRGLQKFITNLPVVGQSVHDALVSSKEAFKRAIYDHGYFTDMGLDYYGPVDGHDIEGLCRVLSAAKENRAPCVVHVVTKKGRGYSFAEKDPCRFHGVGAFNKASGRMLSERKETFSDCFGEYIANKGGENHKICAITAAMTDGTGLSDFKKSYPERFFDVGIAEEHAAVFASGLALEGLIPVTAIYSAFLLRATDEIIHNCILEKKHMVFAIDRAGFVGEDGETHNGVLDVSVFSNFPGVEIYAPASFSELKSMLDEAIDSFDGIAFVRYPKGSETEFTKGYKYSGNPYDVLSSGSDTVVITYGRTFSSALEVLAEKKADIIKLNKLSYVEDIAEVLKIYKKAVFIEEGNKSGGIAEKLGRKIAEEKIDIDYKISAIEGAFVPHMTIEEAFSEYMMDKEGILKTIGE
ncbi:MAG: 1-deoxy-D-xylulose-5-phosphate synthase [Oscillospiraceae bacterium]|nr:1-deoxy-D-xylulose-5-phosphate synthase [Oscillospiraceae bacterium]